MNEWKTIDDDTPKAGTWVLVTGGDVDSAWDNDTSPFAVVAQRLKNGRWQFAWYDSGYYGEYIGPTHWMHLPPLRTRTDGRDQLA